MKQPSNPHRSARRPSLRSVIERNVSGYHGHSQRRLSIGEAALAPQGPLGAVARLASSIALGDEDAKAKTWDAFMADQEWKDIKARTGAEHGQLVGGIRDQMLIPTAYSPSKVG